MEKKDWLEKSLDRKPAQMKRSFKPDNCGVAREFTVQGKKKKMHSQFSPTKTAQHFVMFIMLH